MEAVRLRVEFDNILLTPTTEEEEEDKEELKRCWVLLKPQHKTISDLSSYLLHSFHLHNASPHGLLLSMEGFVLPGFESTSIFKDKDIVRVRKKIGACNVIGDANDNTDVGNELSVVRAEQPEVLGVKFLANEEFEKESGGYASREHAGQAEEETPRDVKTASKKRKASGDLSGSKRKKNKSARAEKNVSVPEGDRIDACKEQNERSKDKFGQRSNKCRKNMPEEKRSRRLSVPLKKVKGVGLLAVYRDCLNQSLKTNSSSKPLENGNENVDAPITSSPPKKFPSRSARRKKAKRRWLREKIKAEREEQHQKQLLENIVQEPSEKQIISEAIEKESQKISEEIHEQDNNGLEAGHEQPVENSDADDDVVPVIIRPGHIRFQSLKKVDADQSLQQNQIPVSFQWNGITSKKKGQKWGREKVAFAKKNDAQVFNQESPALGKRDDGPNLNPEQSRDQNIKEEEIAYDHIEFDKLAPYVCLPKENDVIAYRLIELSSSWTPELSSYRVGKISSYDSQYNRVKLVPVVGCPILPDKKMEEDESAAQPDTSLYSEDGSLEIEFQALLEVRIVDTNKLKPEKSAPVGEVIDVPATNGDVGVEIVPNGHNETNGDGVVPNENGGLTAWKEEISQALSAKKAELSQGDDWTKSERSGRKPWAYRALRGSALGPTMALLRAQNEL